MLERDWQKAIEWIEADPSKAREWHYGIDNTSTNEPILWKRLALHLACTVAAPIGLIDLLLQLYPKALGCPDPHNGSIPMHLACQYGSSLQVVRALIQARTASTKAVDARGRLPLHYAILSAAPYAIIELMVQHDPASVLCPDQEGKTPLQYCQHSYPVGNPVIGLLELVWM
jgi:ankyrin repeat protein